MAKISLSRPATGPLVATLIVVTWAASMACALSFMPTSVWPASAAQILVFFWLQFLYVGLFITAHDACHGSLAPGRPWVNAGFGYICAALYAGFNFNRLAVKHHLHHRYVGTDLDPDYYASSLDKQNIFAWAYQFFSSYVTWQQLVSMTAASQILLHWLVVPPSLVYFYWVAPAVLSAGQLFFFGTYLPHRLSQAEPFVDAYRARNSRLSRPLSLLSCYYFGYHHVHHVRPYMPWYHLPQGLAESATPDHLSGKQETLRADRATSRR